MGNLGPERAARNANRQPRIGLCIPTLKALPGLRKWACGGTQIQYHLVSIERQNAVNKKSAELPTTIGGAVRLMLGLVPDDEQTRISQMRENDLTELNMGLGQWVRNYLGLWGVNLDLLAVTGAPNADDASAVIVRAFCSTLRTLGLVARGVPRFDIFSEVFRSPAVPVFNRDQSYQVRFARSGGESVPWSSANGVLLGFAELGFVMPSGCRVGQCESCAVWIISGKVQDLHGTDPDDASICLACQAIPIEDVVLDA